MNSILQANLSPIEGVPYFDLWVVVAIVVAVIAWFYFRTGVQGVPVIVKWVYKNGSAIELRAKEDLQGIFLEIQNARGKVIETIKKTGIPLEVQEINDKDSKAYLVKFSDNSKRVFLSVAVSRMKHKREYTVLEGTGETVDLLNKNQKGSQFSSGAIPVLTRAVDLLKDGAGNEEKDREVRIQAANGLELILKDTLARPSEFGGPGNSVTLHEERSAAKAFMKDLAEALAGTFRTLIMPMIAGAGVASSAILIVLLLAGKLH